MATTVRPLVCVPEIIAPDALSWLAERAVVVGPGDPRLADWPDIADAIIVRTFPLRAGDLARARRLRVVGKHGIGVDNIDLAACRGTGIRVVNTPGANSGATAELALALALAAARRIPLLDAACRSGRPTTAAERTGIELGGRTLGLLGFGRIAQKVAGMFRHGLGCPVLAYSPNRPDAAFTAAGVERVPTPQDLAARSDILSIHVPLTPETAGLVGADLLDRLPPGAILVNTSRGGIVDETALADALRRGRPAAAASDVFTVEPPPPDHPLLSLPSFIATPHVGATTDAAMARMGREVTRAVITVLSGGLPEDGVVV